MKKEIKKREIKESLRWLAEDVLAIIKLPVLGVMGALAVGASLSAVSSGEWLSAAIMLFLTFAFITNAKYAGEDVLDIPRAFEQLRKALKQ